MIGWKFPSNDHGQYTGLNDAGIETFLGTPLKSLAREILQNSIDAADYSGVPVKVVFELIDIDTDILPNHDELRSIIRKCKSFWGDNKKTFSFLEFSVFIRLLAFHLAAGVIRFEGLDLSRFVFFDVPQLFGFPAIVSVLAFFRAFFFCE